MDHGKTERLAMVKDWLVSQPEQKLLAIWSVEDLSDRVLLTDLDRPGRRRQQIQIMVAKHTDGGVAETAHKTQ